MSNLWWWIWNAHRCLIYGGENHWKNGDALNKVKKMGVLNKLGKERCFKQTRRKGDALNKLIVVGCSKQAKGKGIS